MRGKHGRAGRRPKHQLYGYEHVHVVDPLQVRSTAIWSFVAFFYLAGIAIIVGGYFLDKSQVAAEPVTFRAPTGLPCNNNLKCRPAFYACIQGDINSLCGTNVTITPTLDSKNCSLIIQDALQDPSTLPESVQLFTELVGAPPGAILGASMSDAQMQEAVAFYCPLMFNYVKCFEYAIYT